MRSSELVSCPETKHGDGGLGHGGLASVEVPATKQPRTGTDLCGGPAGRNGLEFFRSLRLPISCPRCLGFPGRSSDQDWS